jgi:two-component system OmpR family response regulator
MKHSPEPRSFTTRRIAIVEGDLSAAEMLHTFFRLMELEPSLVSPDSDAVPTISRLRPDVVLLDLDLPDLQALELARQIRTQLPAVPIIFATDEDPFLDVGDPVIRKPHDRFEDLLRLFELVLAMEER